MSAHLGVLLKLLDPRLRIQVFEAADSLAPESSHGWHNAGTGHAGLCELSYTPAVAADGTVSVEKAIDIFAQFERSKQFWAHAVENGLTGPARTFLHPAPHISFVHGDHFVRFLRARSEGLRAHHFFEGMEFTTDPAAIGAWAPLLVEEREQFPVAATRAAGGTDIDFGSLARQLFAWLARQPGCDVATGARVTGLRKTPDGWRCVITAAGAADSTETTARFVFIGAGGGSLLLLQKAGVPEAHGLGGFPIGGRWLVCENPDVVARHQAKVYGQPQPEAPTMAVPHLDTRVLDGRKSLLFGPFAAWTTRFLQCSGNPLDLVRSIRAHNLGALVRIGLGNPDLIRYLIDQGTQTMENRLRLLRTFYPAAREEDWTLRVAGIRVQAIKKTDGKAGIVHYGTEVITTADRSLCSLLGASPGASVCVAIALEVIEKCFPHLLRDSDSRARLSRIVPGHLDDDRHAAHACRHRVRTAHCAEVLGLP